MLNKIKAWIIERWEKDTWTSKEGTVQWKFLKYDKIEHFILGFLVGLWSIWMALVLGVAKEIWDEFVPAEEFGVWGGDKFSFHDFIAGAVGTLLAFLLKLFIVGVLL